MILTSVRFPARSEPLSHDEATELFLGNAASYLEVPGLLWKAYVRSEDGLVIGGTYLWADRASAEAKYNPGWLQGVTEKYGAPPTIEWFDAAVVVDRRANDVFTEPPGL